MYRVYLYLNFEVGGAGENRRLEGWQAERPVLMGSGVGASEPPNSSATSSPTAPPACPPAGTRRQLCALT